MSVFKATRFHAAVLVAAVAAVSAGAQTHFTFTSATGNNMTVLVQTAINPTVNGQPLASGDEIGVFTPAGLCIGARVWDGVHNRSIAVWGDNDQTPIVDGAKGGETLSFRIWDSSLAQEAAATVTYDTMPPATARGTYAVNGIAILASLFAPPLPSAPVLISPADGATDVPTTPTMQWDSVAGAATYRLQVSTESTFASAFYDNGALTGDSIAIGPLPNSTTCYWRVNATNLSGTGAWSTVWSFTTIVAVPGTTTLLSPADGAANVPLNPTLSWSAPGSGGAPGWYWVQVATESTFASTVSEGTLWAPATTWTASGLSTSTTYYWRVSALNVAGTGMWSSVWNFTTTGTGGLAAPVLVSPVNGATDVSLTPTLVWNASAGASLYRLQVSTVSTFSSLVVDDSLAATSQACGGLSNSTQYFWRVNAKNAGGISAWSSVWNFTTIGTGGLTAPVLVSPVNGATDVSLTPTLVWNASAGASLYRLQVSTVSTFSSLVVDDSLAATSQACGGLSNSTQYFWRVNAKNAGGISAWSSVWNFMTIGTGGLAAPVLILPVNGATGVSIYPTLTWNASAGAATYRLQVSTESTFAATFYDNGALTGDSIAIGPLPNSTTCYWRVNATNLSGTSAWSTVWSYTTVIALPGTVALSLPADGAINVPLNPTLSWSAPGSGGAPGWYWVQVATESTFASTVSEGTLWAPTTTWTASGLSTSTTYYWRVSALNVAGTGPWSTVWSFTTTGGGGLAAPVLVSPVNGATDVSLTPTLVWNASAGAASYLLQVATDSFFVSIILFDSSLTSTSQAVGPLANSTIYYWRVRAENAGGNSAWSTVWSFTTETGTGLAAPILISPVNRATDVVLNPTLTWNASAGATSYLLQVAADTFFISIIHSDSSLTSTSDAISSLTNSTRYFWRVKAENAGGSSAWSEIWSFTTVFGVPGTPTLVSPANNATGVSINPTMLWDSVAGAATYRLQVSTVSTFATTVFDNATLTGNARTIGPLTNNTTYYWRVNATNPSGTGAWSTVWSFTTTAAPAVPTLVSPVNGATDVSLTPTLVWNASAGATSYLLQVAADSFFVSIILFDSSLTSTSQAVGSLANSTTYYWRVRAESAGGSSAWSTVWSFTTLPASGLAAPVLVSPVNRVTDVVLNPTLVWNASAGATNYQLQIATDSSFVSIIHSDSSLTSTSHAISSLVNSTRYFWRVRAKNAGGSSAWSEIWSFTTIIALPGTPTLVSPANSSTGVSINPTMQWNSVAGAATYDLQVSTESTFATTVYDNATLTWNSRTIGPLANGTQYYWRVNATNPSGTGAWSTVWSFTTADIPTVPTLVSPVNGATDVSIAPTLVWNASAGAANYQLQVATDSSFISIILSDSTVTLTSDTISSLVNSATYYWRVRAENAGGSSAWSTVWHFTTIFSVPGTPTLVAPANTAINVSTNPTMQWNSVAGAATYNLQVSTESTFATTVYDNGTLTWNSRTIGPLANNTTYYWRVNATNPSGTGAWSTVWSFTTATLPAVPTLVLPVNGQMDVPTDPTLVWNASAGAVTYQLQVAIESSFISIIHSDSSLTSTSHAISSLVSFTTYYWRVRARNAGGTSAWSSVWNFTTTGTGGLTAPILISPVNGAASVSTSPTMLWDSVAGAATYRLQVATMSTFATTVFNDSLAATSQAVTGLSNSTQYFWRVNASNAGGTSAWSTVWSFTTETGAGLAAPILISPVNGAAGVSINPTVTWNASAGATYYLLELATDSFFVSIIRSDTIFTTSRAVSGLSNSTQYYWRVRAANAGGSSAWSTVWSFTTEAGSGLAAPVLVLPVNGDTNVSITPTLVWNTSAGATGYYVQVSTVSTFGVIVFADSLSDTASSAIGPLVNSTTYYWRAIAENAGGSSAWSTVWSFTTGFGLPGTPTLVSPADGATGVSINPAMVWTSVAGAATYRLQVSTASTFVSTVYDDAALTGNAQSIGPLGGNTTYYWHVNAANPSGTGAWSAVWSFTTGAPPSAPTLVSPVNGATGVSITPTLVWNASAGATNYVVQLAADSSFVSILQSDSTFSSTFVTVSSLVNSTTYYWRAMAENAVGSSAWSAVWSFTTIFGLPGAPTLVSPANSSTGVSTNPTMLWNSVAGAMTYNLQVSTENTFASTVYDNGTLTGNAQSIGPLGGNTTYYWRVNADNPSGTGAWSSVWSFTTGTVPLAPILVSPVNGASGVSITPALAWNASAGASGYYVQVSTVSTFAAIAYEDTLAGITTSAIGPLANNIMYYWRVRAQNAVGNSAWSSIWSFTTEPASFVLRGPAAVRKNMGKPVTVYTLSGRVVSRGVPLGCRAMTSGYYIYKTGDQTKKNASVR